MELTSLCFAYNPGIHSVKNGFDVFDIYILIVDDKYIDRCEKMCDSSVVLQQILLVVALGCPLSYVENRVWYQTTTCNCLAIAFWAGFCRCVR